MDDLIDTEGLQKRKSFNFWWLIAVSYMCIVPFFGGKLMYMGRHDLGEVIFFGMTAYGSYACGIVFLYHKAAKTSVGWGIFAFVLCVIATLLLEWLIQTVDWDFMAGPYYGRHNWQEMGYPFWINGLVNLAGMGLVALIEHKRYKYVPKNPEKVKEK